MLNCCTLLNGQTLIDNSKIKNIIPFIFFLRESFFITNLKYYYMQNKSTFNKRD